MRLVFSLHLSLLILIVIYEETAALLARLVSGAPGFPIRYMPSYLQPVLAGLMGALLPRLCIGAASKPSEFVRRV